MINQNLPLTYSLNAYALHAEQRDDEAEACIKEALKYEPEFTFAHIIRGQIALAKGDYDTGWPLLELLAQRHDADKYQMVRYKDRPLWDGKPTNKKVLIWSSMGLGDMLMMTRFLPLVRERARWFALDTRPELYQLMCFNDVAPEIGVISRHKIEFDYHWPLFSLPLLFKTNINTIPNKPYLLAPDMENNSGCRIGVFRQSFSTLHEEATDRNLPDADFERLIKECPYRMLSLQQEDLKAFDMYDTARFMSRLDLIVTTDSAVAHLAGALGKRTLLMLPMRCCWRWLQDRADSPWYPTMTIFRQRKLKEWGPVIDEVVEAIKNTISGEDPEPKFNQNHPFPYFRKWEKPRTMEALGR